MVVFNCFHHDSSEKGAVVVGSLQPLFIEYVSHRNNTPSLVDSLNVLRDETGRSLFMVGDIHFRRDLDKEC